MDCLSGNVDQLLVLAAAFGEIPYHSAGFLSQMQKFYREYNQTFGGLVMAFVHSKGWYVSKLKEAGYMKHDGRKLESFRTHILRGLYVTHVELAKNR